MHDALGDNMKLSVLPVVLSMSSQQQKENEELTRAPKLPNRPLSLGVCPSGLYVEIPKVQRPRGRHKSARARAKLTPDQKELLAQEPVPGECLRPFAPGAICDVLMMLVYRPLEK